MDNFNPSAIARPHTWGAAWATLLREYEERFEAPLADEPDFDEDKWDMVERPSFHPFSYEAEKPCRALRSWKAYRGTQYR